MKKGKSLLVYLLVAGIIIFSMVYMLGHLGGNGGDYQYSQIMKYFDDLKVSEFELDLGTGKIEMTVDGVQEPIDYKVPNVSVFVGELFNDNYNYRDAYNAAHPDAPVKYNLLEIKDNSMWVSLIPQIILLVIMVALFFFMMRSATGGSKMNNFGKANAKNHLQSGKKATFDDVAGADEEKEELKEIVDFLKNPKKYNEIGARIPKGVLLLGPPGTGKTLLARAVAGEAGVPFYSISGSDFVEMFVGVGASRVRDLFEQAKKNPAAIIFIDEIDAVGRHRGAGLGGGHDEREQTLNQLLVEMDGFDGNQGIIVMAATNRRDILDPALLRPGRFDRQILVSYPDVKGREEILKVHTRGKPLAPDVSLETIAKSTVGFTGADLENLVNEASLLAARRNKKAITKADMEEASIKVIAGPEKKSKVVTEAEKKLTAYHEGGHAICTYYCDKHDKVHQVSIIPRGHAGGFTMSLPEKDKTYVSRSEMKNNIVTLLGGRVAEKIILDDISTGASNDLERATNIARSMVTRYGFSEKLGPVVYGQDDHEVFLGRDFSSNRNYSENVAAEIDSEIRTIIEDAFTKAEDVLTEHIDELHRIAKYLMIHEKIDGADFEKLMKNELDPSVYEDKKDEPVAEETADTTETTESETFEEVLENSESEE